MPITHREVVRRPLRFRKNSERSLVADGITWFLNRDGFFTFPDFGTEEKPIRIPVETLAYLAPLFKCPNIEMPLTPEVLFSTKPGLLPHLTADGKHVFYRLGSRWLYITKAGFLSLLGQVRLVSPKAFRDLSKLRPVQKEST